MIGLCLWMDLGLPRIERVAYAVFLESRSETMESVEDKTLSYIVGFNELNGRQGYEKHSEFA